MCVVCKVIESQYKGALRDGDTAKAEEKRKELEDHQERVHRPQWSVGVWKDQTKWVVREAR